VAVRYHCPALIVELPGWLQKVGGELNRLTLDGRALFPGIDFPTQAKIRCSGLGLVMHPHPVIPRENGGSGR
jgi:hypothetical protein